MKLILFDIDGTLITSSPAGRDVMRVALERIFRTAGPIDSLSFAGMTDRQIVFTLMRAAGYSQAEIDSRLSNVFELMAINGRSRFHDYDLRPCPGVTRLLENLHKLDGIMLGLLTGNNNLTAPMKLRSAGIDPGLFSIGAYGSDAADRDSLPMVAWSKAWDQKGIRFNGKSTVIIGDTPADINCARTCGAKVLAVATGSVELEELKGAKPDFLFNDLTDTNSVLEILLLNGSVP